MARRLFGGGERADGNLVLYRANDAVVWASHTPEQRATAPIGPVALRSAAALAELNPEHSYD